MATVTYTYLRPDGTPYTKEYTKKKNISVMKISNMSNDYNNGVSISEIARNYDLSRPTVYKYLRQAGVV